MTLGPIQLLAVSFPESNFSGQIIAELNRLRDHDFVRLVDALAVRKSADGSLVALQWSDLSIDEAEDMGATVGALIGLGLGGVDSVAEGAEAGRAAGADGHLIDDDELWNIADSIPEGSAAAIALIEHVWATPLRDAIVDAGGIPVSDGWVHPLDLVEIGLIASAKG